MPVGRNLNFAIILKIKLDFKNMENGEIN